MKMKSALLVITVICTWSVGNVECYTFIQTKQLLDTLLTNYESRILPMLDQSNKVELDVSLFISSLNEIDEVKEKLVSTGYLWVMWTDENLKWTPSANNDIHNIFLKQNDIWKPDLVLKNGFTRFKEMGGSFYHVNVDKGGRVLWKPYEVFETRCSIDIAKFPYDKQSCDITFIVWSYANFEVAIKTSYGGVDFYGYEENSVWTVKSAKSSIASYSSESEITFTLELERKPQYYVMNMIIPIICLGLMSVVVFIIPVDAGEKLSYSITVFLAFAVFLTMISGELPVNSESISMLSFYLILQMLTGALVLVISAIQLRLHHRKGTAGIPKFYLRIVILARYLRCKKACPCSRKSNTVTVVKVGTVKECHNKEDDKTEDPSEDSDLDWSDVTTAIDLLCFWLFLIVNIIMTAFLFANIAT